MNSFYLHLAFLSSPTLFWREVLNLPSLCIRIWPFQFDLYFDSKILANLQFYQTK